MTKVIVIADVHDAPAIPKDRMKWIGKHIEEQNPDRVVQIGDFATFDSLCWHIGNETMSGRNKGTFNEDIESFKKCLSVLDNSLKKYKGLKHITYGNHEHRLYKWEQQNPEIYSMMQKQLVDVLTSFGWNHTIYGVFHMIDGVGFTHIPFNIMGKEFGGVSVERNIGQHSLFDVVFGHSHKYNDIRCPKIGDSNYVRVLNVGCSLPYGHVENYCKVCTTGWAWGITEINIFDNHIQDVNFISMKTLEDMYDTRRNHRRS